jgi:hypothetical protein
VIVRTTWYYATVTIPLASMLNGPVVNGVTLVVWWLPLAINVSFVNAFNAVTALFDATLPMDRLLHLLDFTTTVAVAVSQLLLTFNLMDWLQHGR